MEIPSGLSDEIKKKIQERMNKSGAAGKLRKRVSDGIKLAKEEIKTSKKNNELDKYSRKTYFESNKNENEALQRIFTFLQEKGYDWTLSVLENETNIKPESTKTPRNERILERSGYSKVFEISKDEFEENDYIINVKNL